MELKGLMLIRHGPQIVVSTVNRFLWFQGILTAPRKAGKTKLLCILPHHNKIMVPSGLTGKKKKKEINIMHTRTSRSCLFIISCTQ